MKLTPQNLIYHELIGLRVSVADSTNPYQKGISGRVVDETKNTLIIETERGERRIPKKYTTFHFHTEEFTLSVCGSLLLSQPENRIKNRGKRNKLN
jgi:ribonuclease P protein subunit POP4